MGKAMNLKTNDNLDLELQTASNQDFVLYYDKRSNKGYEIEFDGGKFNGAVSYCADVNADDSEWFPVTDLELAERLKSLAQLDYQLSIK